MTLKSIAVNIIRWTIPPAIVAYLVYDVSRTDGLNELWAGSIHWPLLGLGVALYALATLLTIARWYWLVRALDMPFRWSDAMRLGFLGYLLTFVSLGALGGDLLKAFFVGREQPRRRVEAFATVLIDRVLGLYSLLLLAAGAILFSGVRQNVSSPAVEVLCRMVFLATLAGTVGLVAAFALGRYSAGRHIDWLYRLPLVGDTIRKVIAAVGVYRRDLPTVIHSVGVGLVVQIVASGSLWATAAALVPTAPSLAEHLVIMPLALLTTILPVPGQGLGVLEFAVANLYQHLAGMPPAQGLLVAFGLRLVMVGTGLISAVVYLLNRRAVAAVLKESRAEQAKRAA